MLLLGLQICGEPLHQPPKSRSELTCCSSKIIIFNGLWTLTDFEPFLHDVHFESSLLHFLQETSNLPRRPSMFSCCTTSTVWNPTSLFIVDGPEELDQECENVWNEYWRAVWLFETILLQDSDRTRSRLCCPNCIVGQPSNFNFQQFFQRLGSSPSSIHPSLIFVEYFFQITNYQNSRLSGKQDFYVLDLVKCLKPTSWGSPCSWIWVCTRLILGKLHNTRSFKFSAIFSSPFVMQVSFRKLSTQKNSN